MDQTGQKLKKTKKERCLLTAKIRQGKNMIMEAPLIDRMAGAPCLLCLYRKKL